MYWYGWNRCELSKSLKASQNFVESIHRFQSPWLLLMLMWILTSTVCSIRGQRNALSVCFYVADEQTQNLRESKDSGPRTTVLHAF